MTLRGLLVLVLELVFVILAFGTEFKNFVFLALCVGGLLVFSLFSLALASLLLGAGSSLSVDTTLRGETTSYTLNFYGIALFPVAVYFFVKTTDVKFVAKRKMRHSFLLLPTFLVRRRFVFEMPSAHVGEWEIGIKKMRVEDLFGFFSLPVIWCKRSNLIKKITILPNVYDFDEIDARDSSGGFGSTNLLNTENGELLGDSRDFRDGDSLKRINWKLTARTRKLHSRLFETPQEPTVTIVVDTAVFGDRSDDMVDIACETAISLAKYFVGINTAVKVTFARCKDGLEVRTFDLYDQADLLKIYPEFTNKIFSTRTDELDLTYFEGMQILNSNRVYVISANPSDNLISTFTEINKSGKVAYCIVPVDKGLDAQAISLKTRDLARLSIASADQIKAKVGEVL
ncbi:MAG: DUF58 domain-containing protein [Clostridia bacterium]|nr:DUF58 domain-containing protein [Clostridia bacterium]